MKNQMNKTTGSKLITISILVPVALLLVWFIFLITASWPAAFMFVMLPFAFLYILDLGPGLGDLLAVGGIILAVIFSYTITKVVAKRDALSKTKIRASYVYWFLYVLLLAPPIVYSLFSFFMLLYTGFQTA